MLSARELGVGIAGKRLLRGVDFDVADGEVLAVVGPSGSGKTTLLRTLVGLIDPLEGGVTLAGESPQELGFTRFRRLVMLVAQRPVVFEGTVEDNLRRPFRNAAVDAAFDADAAERLLTSLLVPGVLAQPARTLSEGQAQRVCLARAMLLAPRVLVLDEPTSALDTESRDAVERMLIGSEMAVIIVSHDPDQVARLATRTLDLGPYAEAS